MRTCKFIHELRSKVALWQIQQIQQHNILCIRKVCKIQNDVLFIYVLRDAFSNMFKSYVTR